MVYLLELIISSDKHLKYNLGRKGGEKKGDGWSER